MQEWLWAARPADVLKQRICAHQFSQSDGLLQRAVWLVGMVAVVETALA
jgi:hypothetical protein